MIRLRSPRLASRVAAFFGIIGLLAGLGLTTAAYSVARQSLLDQRIATSRATAFDHALELRDAFEQGTISETFQSLDIEEGGFAVLTRPALTFLLQFPETAFPTSLRDAVADGKSGQQRFEYEGENYIGIGVHIEANNSGYFEAFPLNATERTLAILVTALLVGSLLAALLAVFFGFSTSRGLLRPLTRVATTASDIAGGSLDARLEPTDDPELTRLVTAFNNMADAVQSRIEREERFASEVSHELRSPITAMTAAAEVLAARREELSERSQQALDLLIAQVRRFDAMVIDLLELSRLEAGAIDGHLEEVDIGDLSHRILARSSTPTTPLTIKSSKPIIAVTDRVRYERILSNLIENAHVHAKGATEVIIDTQRLGDVVIMVDDAGSGVDPADRSRIFERFTRGGAARHREGTGLGLALVAEHASALGGWAYVDDSPAGGARFVVVLPKTEPTLLNHDMPMETA